jgi:hypothetical protein
LIQCPPGTCVHRRGEPVTAIYLIIHGRLRVSVADLQGRQIMDRYQGAGGPVRRSGRRLGGAARSAPPAADPTGPTARPEVGFPFRRGGQKNLWRAGHELSIMAAGTARRTVMGG